jgi:hypothetical protein
MGITLFTHLEAMIAHNLITFENNFVRVGKSGFLFLFLVSRPRSHPSPHRGGGHA